MDSLLNLISIILLLMIVFSLGCSLFFLFRPSQDCDRAQKIFKALLTRTVLSAVLIVLLSIRFFGQS